MPTPKAAAAKTILVLSDLHAGSVAGLVPPEWQKHHKKWRFLMTPLWNWYAETLRKIGPVDTLVVNGDAVDGEGKKDSIGHITTDTEEQADMAEAAIREAKFRSIFFTYGTPFHTAGTYSYENTLAAKFAAPIRDTIFLDVHGLRFSFRHVTGQSATPYTAPTQLFKEVVRDMFDALNSDSEQADIVIRSHVHHFFDISNGRRRGIQTPCLQMPESVFGRKCRPFYYDVGMLKVTVRPGDTIHTIDAIPYILPLKIVKRREYVKV